MVEIANFCKEHMLTNHLTSNATIQLGAYILSKLQLEVPTIPLNYKLDNCNSSRQEYTIKVVMA